MKRFMFVIHRDGLGIDGEGWKRAALLEGSPEEFAKEIRTQLKEEVPVVIIPDGLNMYVIELSSDEKPAEAAKAEAPP